MTRLTNLHITDAGGENRIPIPFPTQFCNMIYLQRFISRHNNFSGFLKEEISSCLNHFGTFLGPIPPNLTRLVRLKSLDLAYETSLEGFIERRIDSFSSFGLKKLGEFPLVEGCFQILIQISLPNRISSFG